MEFFVKNFLGGLWVPYGLKRFLLVIVGGEHCVGLLSDCPNIRGGAQAPYTPISEQLFGLPRVP